MQVMFSRDELFWMIADQLELKLRLAIQKSKQHTRDLSNQCNELHWEHAFDNIWCEIYRDGI